MLPAFVWARDWGRRSTSHSTAETAGVQGVTLPPWCLAGWSKEGFAKNISNVRLHVFWSLGLRAASSSRSSFGLYLLQVSAVPCLGYMGSNKETWGTHHRVLPQVSGSLCSQTSLHLSEKKDLKFVGITINPSYLLLHTLHMNLVRDSFGCKTFLVKSDPRRSRAHQV